MEYPNRYISYWKEDKNGKVVSNIVTQVLCLRHREELMDLGFVLRGFPMGKWAGEWNCHKCIEESEGKLTPWS